jgi:putative hydrolase of the HAD superfamily
VALRAAIVAAGHRFSARVLDLYRRINAETWAAYQRGEIDPASLSRVRFCRLLGEMGHDEAAGGALGAAYLDALGSRGDLVPGARAAMRETARLAHIGAVTNGIDRVQRARLRAARMEARFEVVVTSEACGFVKPDPRILHQALSALGAAAGEAAYVGDDARVDGGAARAAGVRFWWIDRGFGGPPPEAMDRRLRGVAEVPALLRRSS